MYSVYILRSLKDGGFYIGFTARTPGERFVEHENGLVDSTRDRRPIRLVYVEGFASENDARERERQLKSFGSAYKGLMLRIQGSINPDRGGVV